MPVHVIHRPALGGRRWPCAWWPIRSGKLSGVRQAALD